MLIFKRFTMHRYIPNDDNYTELTRPQVLTLKIHCPNGMQAIIRSDILEANIASFSCMWSTNVPIKTNSLD